MSHARNTLFQRLVPSYKKVQKSGAMLKSWVLKFNLKQIHDIDHVGCKNSDFPALSEAHYIFSKCSDLVGMKNVS